MTKSSLGREGPIWLTHPDNSPLLRETRAETQAGSEADTMEEGSTGLFTLLSYTTQDHLPRDGTAHSGQGPPMSVNNEENVTQTCSQANQREVILQLRSLPPRQLWFVSSWQKLTSILSLKVKKQQEQQEKQNSSTHKYSFFQEGLTHSGHTTPYYAIVCWFESINDKLRVTDNVLISHWGRNQWNTSPWCHLARSEARFWILYFALPASSIVPCLSIWVCICAYRMLSCKSGCLAVCV